MYQIKNMILSPYLTTITRVMVGLVFLYTGFDKIANPAYLAGSIQNYQILPEMIINLVAICLPWLELICGMLLLSGFWHQPAAMIISTLIFIFILALGSVIFRGMDIECGCFGSGSSANWGRILEDLVLLVFSLHIVFHPSSALALENLIKKPD